MNCHPMHGCPHGQDAKGGMPQGMKGMGPKTLEDGSPACRLIAWEVTRSCNLACRHCRAEAHLEPYPGELDHDEAIQLIDTFSQVGNPLIIFMFVALFGRKSEEMEGRSPDAGTED